MDLTTAVSYVSHAVSQAKSADITEAWALLRQNLENSRKMPAGQKKLLELGIRYIEEQKLCLALETLKPILEAN
jgi:hypothetical protein